MPNLAPSTKTTHVKSRKRAASGRRREEDRLVSRARALIAEARRLVAKDAAARGAGSANRDEQLAFRRRALLIVHELRGLLDSLKAARDGVDSEVKTMTSHRTAVNAYTHCRRVGQEYARDVRRRK